ncbi:iron uptake transporter deferrochelatase/peroxidase subunit [Cnuibacter physcomitrellae]|uniref:iron uptake transporter deferrochelatase/peroxidase subunit n=1 Tax=Cnuibacter physcomitrellae TaxID=1619308 RepID=UPI002175D26D|nr:iron uptake transporter deferrochelatase/peroxidase subunit [Cnuibacter physcomitrellae]MCS5496577.1 iron uptake transporter deferrochelatase/peroxidase subunit [Cnuibacter physcomitrellae]
MPEHDDQEPEARGLSRRGLFGLGAGLLGAGLGAGATFAVGQAVSASAGGGTATSATVYPFYDDHQAGIVTPAQDRLHFASFDVADISRDDLVGLLQDWADAAALMTAGTPAGRYGAVNGPYDAPPDDTGEALGLPASGLTLTFGFGPSLFTAADGTDRFGLASQRPDALVDLPHFPADALVETLTGGDLCIQACSEDPQVAVHAIRNLSRIAFGRAALRWSQLGFGRTSSTSTAQQTPRNLFGFKDGTANIKAEDRTTVDAQVWAQPGDGPSWMDGGSYLVARKIRMTIETWDRTSLREQEAVIGRTKGEGAPYSGGTEFTAPDFSATGQGGKPLIAADSHVRLAHPDQNSGAQLLRRGYNFVDGNDDLGRLNAGLFFIAYQRDPRTQFIPIQENLAKNDAMNEYVRHVGSGIWAIPPGARTGSFPGAPLFA